MPDLELCPFCGGDAGFDTLFISTGRENCIVCEDCGCLFTVVWDCPTKEHLADIWNRRANDEKPQ